jgi:hypothetical protein
MENSKFEENGYYVYRNLISEDAARHISEHFKLLRDISLFRANNDASLFVDRLVNDNCFVWYAPVDYMLTLLQSKIEKATNKSLIPTYSFGRVYYTGAIMNKHKDRPSCEISATLCTSIDGDPWPIWITNKEGIDVPVELFPGDAMIYRGIEMPHWRNKYTEGKEQVQFFLHWIDANGPHTDWKFDKRPMLGLPCVPESGEN